MYADTTVTGDGPADVGNAPLDGLSLVIVDMFCFLHITSIYHLCSIAQRPVKRKSEQQNNPTQSSLDALAMSGDFIATQ